MSARPSSERARRQYDAAASGYDRAIGAVERRVFGEQRDWAVARAHGEVLELAVGTGLNLPRYGPQVTRVLGVDLSAGMLEQARARIGRERLGGRMEVREGDVQRLDLPGASVDTVLATYALCTLPDPLAALHEARRVLRPGGRLVLVEHGVPRAAPLRAALQLVNPLSIRLAADDLLGDPHPLVEQAGFTVLESDRAGLGGIVHRVLARR